MPTTPRLAMLPLAAACLALVPACGSSSSGASTGAVSSQAPQASGNLVSARSTSLGTILVDSKGHTIYAFANDKANVSNCSGVCAADWPPVTVSGTAPSSVPGVTGTIGSITRSDGSHQLTVASHPLYTFSGDSNAGQTNGQGINLNGGVWTVVSPAGAPQTNPAGASSQAPGLGY
jgi:predicted lipoprotein with Yx(FWY)xxD motif